VIRVEQASKRFGAQVAVDGVSFHVPPSTVTVLIGPSGSGKSTVLRLINGLERLDAGRIVLDGLPLDPAGRNLERVRAETGMVFQQFNLFPHLRVLENLTLAPRLVRRRAAGVVEEEARALLQKVGLADMADRFPAQLSGGEQQRVAIARALVNDPQLVLADEPTGNLDPDLSLEIMNLFREINARGTTVVVATHDRELIRRVGRRALTLEHGRIVEVG